MVYPIFKNYPNHVNPVFHSLDRQIIVFNFYLVEDSTCHTLTSGPILHITAKTRRLPRQAQPWQQGPKYLLSLNSHNQETDASFYLETSTWRRVTWTFSSVNTAACSLSWIFCDALCVLLINYIPLVLICWCLRHAVCNFGRFFFGFADIVEEKMSGQASREIKCRGFLRKFHF